MYTPRYAIGVILLLFLSHVCLGITTTGAKKKHVQAEHQMDRPRHIDDQSSAPNPCVWLQSWRIALHPFLGNLRETRQE